MYGQTVVISRIPLPASLPRSGNSARLSATSIKRSPSRAAAAGLKTSIYPTIASRCATASSVQTMMRNSVADARTRSRAASPRTQPGLDGIVADQAARHDIGLSTSIRRRFGALIPVIEQGLFVAHAALITQSTRSVYSNAETCAQNKKAARRLPLQSLLGSSLACRGGRFSRRAGAFCPPP